MEKNNKQKEILKASIEYNIQQEKIKTAEISNSVISKVAERFKTNPSNIKNRLINSFFNGKEKI